MSTEQPIPRAAEPDSPTLRRYPIQDCGEALVPTSLVPEKILARPRYHLEGLPGALGECFLRESVFERLLAVADALGDDYRLVIFDGWRPASLQRWLYDRCVAEFEAEGAADPVAAAEGFVTRPLAEVETSPPFHLTGGAVDLTLADRRGRLLAMGTDFDTMTSASFTAHYEAEGQDTTVRANRRRLYHAMTAAGFANLPSEWWHYDYGDQLWAWTTDAPQAIYGPTEPSFRWGELP